MSRKGLSKPQLAEKIGVHKQTLYDYYKQKAEVTIKTLALISKVFEVDICWWFKPENIDYEEVKENFEPNINEEQMENKKLWKQIEQKDNEINSLLKRIEFLENLMSENRNQSTGS